MRDTSVSSAGVFWAKMADHERNLGLLNAEGIQAEWWLLAETKAPDVDDAHLVAYICPIPPADPEELKRLFQYKLKCQRLIIYDDGVQKFKFNWEAGDWPKKSNK